METAAVPDDSVDSAAYFIYTRTKKTHFARSLRIRVLRSFYIVLMYYRIYILSNIYNVFQLFPRLLILLHNLKFKP